MLSCCVFMYQVIVPIKFMTMAQVKRIDLEDKKRVLLRKDFSYGILSIYIRP